jgi:ribA/ribD-fused uncharacterized protein
VFNKSAEHAYQWCKATEAKNYNLAEKIKNAEHAGKAKMISKAIPHEDSLDWEKNNVAVMKKVIKAKFDQVKEFKDTLLGYENCYLAEATSDTFWACGLNAETAAKISPLYHQGQNTLGALLMEIRDTHLHTTESSDSELDIEKTFQYIDGCELKAATTEKTNKRKPSKTPEAVKQKSGKQSKK